jgi:hypothetical protein
MQPNELSKNVLEDVVIQIPFLPDRASGRETDLHAHQNLMTSPKLWLVEEFGLFGDPLLAIAKP